MLFQICLFDYSWMYWLIVCWPVLVRLHRVAHVRIVCTMQILRVENLQCNIRYSCLGECYFALTIQFFNLFWNITYKTNPVFKVYGCLELTVNVEILSQVEIVENKSLCFNHSCSCRSITQLGCLLCLFIKDNWLLITPI